MRKAQTICVSLSDEYVEILKRLAAESGSNSAAVRRLLDAFARSERLRGMEEAYRAYFADSAAVKAEQDLTEAMLSVSTWGPPAKERHGRKRSPARGHLRGRSRAGR